jgi:hypothetical protein
MACKDVNESKKLAASGCAINEGENLVSFKRMKKKRNMKFIKKHKICIIYAAQHTSGACMYVSIDETGKKEILRAFLILLLYPLFTSSFDIDRRNRTFPESFKAQRSIIPSANLENHGVYLFSIIYANFSSSPVFGLRIIPPSLC